MIRRLLYRTARIMNDLHAVETDRVPQRIVRRVVYRLANRAAQRLTKRLK